ncbi:MAG: ribose-5-phosphate isomerase A [Dehalococcoidia bacterium]|nr:MAG: ribose-5-phosphate isomerase A [Dehalococcoidia bacterium]
MTADPHRAAKEVAVARAVQLIEDGMVLGLGTGTTAELLFPWLGARLAQGWRLQGVASSVRTEALARGIGLPLVPLTHPGQLDLTIDGADEVDPQLRLVKGRGGALLREKVLAQASRRLVIVVDESKLVPQLGSRALLPVEVVPFGWQVVRERLLQLGAQTVTLRREGKALFHTDNGNLVLDCQFAAIASPEQLDIALHRVAGVVEHGLFLGLATVVLVGRADGTVQELWAERP